MSRAIIRSVKIAIAIAIAIFGTAYLLPFAFGAAIPAAAQSHPVGIDKVSATLSHGCLTVIWQPGSQAAYHRIGWAKESAVRAAALDGRHWYDAFGFYDVQNIPNAPSHQRIGCGFDDRNDRYAVIVGELAERFGQPTRWSDWYITPPPKPLYQIKIPSGVESPRRKGIFPLPAGNYIARFHLYDWYPETGPVIGQPHARFSVSDYSDAENPVSYAGIWVTAAYPPTQMSIDGLVASFSIPTACSCTIDLKWTAGQYLGGWLEIWPE